MSAPEIKVDQHWQEVDPRFVGMPVREVLEVGPPFSMAKRGGGRIEHVRFVTMRALDGGRKTVARTHLGNGQERFNGKRGGYKLVKDVPA